MASGSGGYEAAGSQPVDEGQVEDHVQEGQVALNQEEAAARQVQQFRALPLDVQGIDVSANPIVGNIGSMHGHLAVFYAAFYHMHRKLPPGPEWEPVRARGQTAFEHAFDFTSSLTIAIKGLSTVKAQGLSLQNLLKMQAKLKPAEPFAEAKLKRSFQLETTQQHLQVLRSAADSGLEKVKEATGVLGQMVRMDMALSTCMNDLEKKTEEKMKLQEKLDQCWAVLAKEKARKAAFSQTLASLEEMSSDAKADFDRQQEFLENESNKLQNVIDRGPDEYESLESARSGFLGLGRSTKAVKKLDYTGVNLAKASAKEVRDKLQDVLKDKQNRSDALAKWKEDAKNNLKEAEMLIKSESEKLHKLQEDFAKATTALEGVVLQLKTLKDRLGTDSAEACYQAGLSISWFSQACAGQALESSSQADLVGSLSHALAENVDFLANLDTPSDQLEAMQMIMDSLKIDAEEPASYGTALAWLEHVGRFFNPITASMAQTVAGHLGDATGPQQLPENGAAQEAHEVD